jgi:hypothetical protein
MNDAELNRAVNEDFAGLLAPAADGPRPVRMVTYRVHAEWRDGTVMDREVKVPLDTTWKMQDAVRAECGLTGFDPDRVRTMVQRTYL